MYPVGMKYHDHQPIRHVGDVAAMGADRYGEKTALIFRGNELTYTELDARANQIANALVDAGLQPDQRVGICMENNLEYMPAFFGIIKAGGVPVPLNFRRSETGLVYVLEDSGVNIVIGSEYFTDQLESLHEAAGLEHTFVPDSSEVSGVEHYDEWVDDRPETFDRPKREFDDVAVQPYTSGTTGDPKGVLSTHKNVITSVNTLEAASGTDPEFTTVLTITPLFHGLGLIGTTLGTLYGGGTVVLRNLPEPDALLEAITEYNIKSFSAVPAIFTDMVNELENNPEKYDVSPIEFLGSAGAPLADDTRQRIEGTFNVPLIEGWAMTEILVAGTLTGARGLQKGAGCIGQPAPMPGFDYRMRLVDPETRETRVPWDHLDPTAPADLTGYEPDFDDEKTYTGEIAVRGPQVMKGYHNSPEKNEQVFDDEGWFYTGDIARVDEDRFLWMVDRADDMMIVGGENVYPTEIEDALFLHPEVKEAGVVPAPHEVKGEAPVAYVVTEEDADPSEEDLRRYTLDHLPTYAHPRRIFVLDDLPRSGTEKVQRYKLEERVESDIEGEALEPSEEL
jgi:long-chain acyl-CoA synthetase